MFDRFTERSRDAFAIARDEAQALGGASLGAEYLFLGLLGRECGAVHIIQQLGVDVGVLHGEMLARIEVDLNAPCSRDCAFSDDALRILELAMEEAGDGSDQYIGTEHLLVALLRESDNAAAALLLNHGIVLERVRAEVRKLAGPDSPASRER